MIHTRTKIIALIAASLFLLTLFAYSGVAYMLRNHKATLAAERIAVADAEMQKKSLSDLIAIVESSADERETMRGYILEDDKIIDLLSLIGTLAKEQGVTYTTSNLMVTPIDDTFEALEFTVAVTGSFERVMRVLTLLETLPQQSSIPSVLFTKTENVETRASEWQGSIDIRVTKFKNV